MRHGRKTLLQSGFAVEASLVIRPKSVGNSGKDR
jgi:hypothetical protein